MNVSEERVVSVVKVKDEGDKCLWNIGNNLERGVIAQKTNELRTQTCDDLLTFIYY